MDGPRAHERSPSYTVSFADADADAQVQVATNESAIAGTNTRTSSGSGSHTRSQARIHEYSSPSSAHSSKRIAVRETGQQLQLRYDDNFDAKAEAQAQVQAQAQRTNLLRSSSTAPPIVRTILPLAPVFALNDALPAASKLREEMMKLAYFSKEDISLMDSGIRDMLGAVEKGDKLPEDVFEASQLAFMYNKREEILQKAFEETPSLAETSLGHALAEEQAARFVEAEDAIRACGQRYFS